jgi:hypothetical protein
VQVAAGRDPNQPITLPRSSISAATLAAQTPAPSPRCSLLQPSLVGRRLENFPFLPSHRQPGLRPPPALLSLRPPPTPGRPSRLVRADDLSPPSSPSHRSSLTDHTARSYRHVQSTAQEVRMGEATLGHQCRQRVSHLHAFDDGALDRQHLCHRPAATQPDAPIYAAHVLASLDSNDET